LSYKDVLATDMFCKLNAPLPHINIGYHILKCAQAQHLRFCCTRTNLDPFVTATKKAVVKLA
jgi:hypothetical protein